jgi:hypothetical protein
MSKFTATALAVLSTVCVLSFSAPTQAAVISSTVPEYNGAFEDPSLTYPLPSVLIGTFSYTIPAGDHITGAIISGAFGNLDQANTTALSDYFVGSVEVAACDSTSDPCFSADINDPPTAWTYTFTASQLAALAAGSANFSVVQTGPFSVQTGVTELDLTVATAAIPEPAGIFLLAVGLAGIALLRWKQSRLS